MHTSSRSDTPSLRPFAWRWPAVLTVLAAFVLVIGCAQTPPIGDPDPDPDPEPEPGPTVLSGTAAWADFVGGEPGPLLAVSLWMLDLEVPGPGVKAATSTGGSDGSQALRSRAEGLGVDTLRSSAVVEFEDGFLAGLGPVAADGTYELVLPDGDAIPEALFRDAENAIPVQLYAGSAECTLTASDPAARVTLTFFEGITIASPAFLTAKGLAIGLTTTEAVNPDFDFEADIGNFTYVSLAYATAPTTLTTTGAACAPEPGLTVDVDVDLAAGWNQVTWVFVLDDSLTVRRRPVDEPLFSLVIPADLEGR